METKTLSGGYVKLIPDEGKILLCKLTNSTHSEAIVKENEIEHFTEISVSE